MSEILSKPETTRFSFPSVVLKPEVWQKYSGEELMLRSLSWLKRRGLYRPDLLYAGFNGGPVYKRGGFGERTSTFAVNEFSWARELKDSLDGVNPLVYADDNGNNLLALGVFNPDLLMEISQHPRYEEALRQLDNHEIDCLPVDLNDNNHFVTPDDSSLDTATVAVLFFKSY